MTVYDELRQALGVREVGAHLGLKVSQSGYMQCPDEACPGNKYKKKRTPVGTMYGTHFKCCACGLSGDAVKLIEHAKGISSAAALAEAKALAGMAELRPRPQKERPHDEPAPPPDLEQRIEALNIATLHYHRILTEGAEYLHSLGVEGLDGATQTAQRYVREVRGFAHHWPVRVGIVPGKRTGLAQLYTPELRQAAIRAGILQSRGTERLDGRLFLPWEHLGNTVSYKARAIEALKHGQKWASPRMSDTGRGLVQMPRPPAPFGVDAAVTMEGTWAVVEGELDALALLIAGVPAVAVGGTSGVGAVTLQGVLPDERAALLYDGDEAGRAGAEKQGRRLGIPWATMPGSDPADVLKMLGPDQLRQTALKAIASAQTAEAKRTEIEAEDESLVDLCTEQGTARAFVAWAAGRLLFLNDRDRWAMFTGKRWEAQPKRAPDVVALFEKFFDTFHERVDALRAAGLEEDAELVEEWRLRLRSRTVAKNVDDYAKADTRVQSSMADFDQHDMLLNCTNGTVDLSTGELLEHDPAHRLMQMTGCAYRRDARSKVWDDIVSKVMVGRSNLVQYLKRALGYTLTGRAGEECFWFHHGAKGRNGKGTFFATVQAALGDYQQSADARTFIRKRFATSGPTEDIAELAGKRAIFASEWDRGQQLDEALIKNLTGQDIVRARFLNEGGFQFMPIFKLHISTNYLPSIGGQDGGIWDRVLVLRWDAYFGADDRDPDLKRKLRSNEVLEAVLAWMVEGCMDYQEDGLRHPEEVVRWTSEYREESDTLGEWLEERTEDDPNGWTDGQTLYANYCGWCEAVRERAIGRKSFAQALVERGFPRGRNAQRTKRGHKGILLVSAAVSPLRAV